MELWLMILLFWLHVSINVFLLIDLYISKAYELLAIMAFSFYIFYLVVDNIALTQLALIMTLSIFLGILITRVFKHLFDIRLKKEMEN